MVPSPNLEKKFTMTTKNIASAIMRDLPAKAPAKRAADVYPEAAAPEVTPAMIRAGLDRFDELSEFRPDRVYVVKEIYAAMWRAENGESRDRVPE
jgi:hypothetical protein